MQVTIDSVGRLVVPKVLRDELGLAPGSTVEVTRYGEGLHVSPGGRTARLVRKGGALVATSDTVVDDEVVFGIIDALRR